MAVVLIVEDEAFIRQAAEWTIGDLGHDTLLAADLTEALAHLRMEQPIDALFVDIRLDTGAHGGTTSPMKSLNSGQTCGCFIPPARP